MTYAELAALVLAQPDLAALAAEPYELHGIFTSEMAALIALIREARIDFVIESGRARGQSTYLIAKYLPRIEFVSVERRRDRNSEFSERRLAGMPVRMRYGDAVDVVPRLIRRASGRRVALLLDGPKGAAALSLLSQCIALNDSVKLGFIHDMRRRERGGGGVSADRRAAEMLFPAAMFTDDATYVAAASHLDDRIWKTDGVKWTPFHKSGEFLESYGPTLGMFMISDDDRTAASERVARNGVARRSPWRRLKRRIRYFL